MSRLMRAGGIRFIDLASRAGTSLNTLYKMSAGGEEAYASTVHIWLRVAAALGCSLEDLLPIATMRPRSGLLWERGVYRVRGMDRAAADAQVEELSRDPDDLA